MKQNALSPNRRCVSQPPRSPLPAVRLPPPAAHRPPPAAASPTVVSRAIALSNESNSVETECLLVPARRPNCRTTAAN